MPIELENEISPFGCQVNGPSCSGYCILTIIFACRGYFHVRIILFLRELLWHMIWFGGNHQSFIKLMFLSSSVSFTWMAKDMPNCISMNVVVPYALL
jgi:hypothetical protein